MVVFGAMDEKEQENDVRVVVGKNFCVLFSSVNDLRQSETETFKIFLGPET